MKRKLAIIICTSLVGSAFAAKNGPYSCLSPQDVNYTNTGWTLVSNAGSAFLKSLYTISGPTLQEPVQIKKIEFTGASGPGGAGGGGPAVYYVQCDYQVSFFNNPSVVTVNVTTKDEYRCEMTDEAKWYGKYTGEVICKDTSNPFACEFFDLNSPCS